MDHAQDKTPLLLSLIRDRAIRALFQPIVDLNDGMVIAYEALCRPLPDRGFANADDLFHSAETCSLLWELEEVTRAAALDAASGWPRDTRLFLNTSPSVFGDPRFAQAAADAVGRIPALSPDQIVLEITERSESRFDDQLLQQVTIAKEAGFNIAVDDAGAGTSGLNRMMRIRPHWIKLDRQLIAGIDSDPFKQNLVRFFVHFARMSAVSVIAEGIERAPELATLMSLGVRFAQGYYLGKPADRHATMDPQAVSDIRQRWAVVEQAVPPEPQLLPMARLCTSVQVIEAGIMPIARVAALLAENPEHQTVVVTEGRRLIGWIDRASVALACDGPAANTPISAIIRPATCALTPDATVQEALNFVCTRDDDELAQPLIVATGAQVVGIVQVRDLLRAAAAEARPGAGQRAPLTGLPARVRADQHLEQMIARGREPALRRSREYHADAAFIDIRRFADYNGVFGYEMGDRLIRTLGEQINSCVVRAAGGGTMRDVFLGHLGDDRFIVTARAGLLEARLKLLMQTFEQVSPSLTDPTLLAQLAPEDRPAPRATQAGPGLGLRVLHIPAVFDRVTHARDLYRIEQQLRQKARNQEQTLLGVRSLLVVDERNPSARAVRLSA